ncbi:MAG: hypothetical protein KatS3mg031_0323 [Chitinophagales bacterium]|nr:MAG: hypothetical protein KatS3mg031_0323 [Chitinophagales bacterium]
MLRYEVNKEAISTKTTAPGYQFELLQNAAPHKLLVIGQFGKFVAKDLTGFNYQHKEFLTISEIAEYLEEEVLRRSWEPPAAILCDQHLPDGNAFSLFKTLQSHRLLSRIPFIIIANERDEAKIHEARKLGVDDYYVAPVNAEDLHVRIAFLSRFKNEKQKIALTEEPVFENRISLLKRILDITIAASALLILSPLLLLIAIIIKLESRGPVIYVSKRVGTGYQIFDLYKFRSMRQGADLELKKLQHLNQYKSKETEKVDMAFFKLQNDPRVTRFGRFLRATSLDEIPQLFNVIKGDMSIVGNRPLPLYEAEQLTRDMWAKRFLAPAGLTGLWQVSRRGKEEMSVSERVILDNTYADCHSLWLDIKIMLKTFPALISRINS